VPDHEEYPCFLGAPHHGLSVWGGQRQRLLTEYVPAVIEGNLRLRTMQIRRQTKIHRHRFHLLQHLPKRSGDRNLQPKLTRVALGGNRIRVGNPNQPDSGI
jgi:hypothetical protein